MADLSSEGPTIETFVVGEELPTSIIPKDKAWYVQVKWRTTGTDWAALTGSWDVQMFIESIEKVEPSPALSDRHLTVPLRPMPSPVNYGPVNYEFEAHSISAGIYRLYISVHHINLIGGRSGISGFSEQVVAILPELDIHAAAERAILTDVSVAVDSKDIVATSEGVEIGNSSGGRSIVMTYNEAYGKIVDAVERELKLNLAQARKQAQSWFQASLIVAIVAAILIVIGLVLLIRGNVSPGMVSAVSGILTEAIAALFYAQSREANGRVDSITTKMDKSREFFSLMGMVYTVKDQTSQDRLIADFVLKALEPIKNER